MSRKNFGEFMKFFPKGLNPFKIQTIFNFGLIPRFLIYNPEGIGSRAKNERCSLMSSISPQKVS
jgi:hypothetical protein